MYNVSKQSCVQLPPKTKCTMLVNKYAVQQLPETKYPMLVNKYTVQQLPDTKYPLLNKYEVQQQD